MTQRQLTPEDIKFVNDLARAAGQLAVRMRADAVISEKSGPKDFVTDADLACSHLIVEQLKSRFPHDAIISEEDSAAGAQTSFDPSAISSAERTWMIDPIDGTENYIANDGMYTVMIGLLIDNKPGYGWVYQPTADVLYVAVPGQPVQKITSDKSLELPYVCLSLQRSNIKLMMGNRDRDQHNWVETVPGVGFVYSGSVGLRVAMIIEGAADVYAHLAGKLKVWDTAAPAAMALCAGLEVGSFDFDGIRYFESKHMHEYAIAFGRPGTLAWMRENLRAPRAAETPVIASVPVSTFLPL